MNRVVVTGGNSGMGLETVKLFLEQGDKVVFTSRSTEKAQKVLQQHPEEVAEKRLFFCQCNSAKASDVEKLVQFVSENMGGCDVLVNCAAIFLGGLAHETSEEDFDLQMEIDFKGVFLTCKAFLPQMVERKHGNLITISSLAGVRANYNCPIYCAAKAAVNNFMRCLALDYGRDGIRSNAVCPSATETEMFLCGSTQEVIDAFHHQNPMGRISKPIEIAKVIRFLASEDASFINGQCISVDGGLVSWAGEPRQDKTENRK